MTRKIIPSSRAAEKRRRKESLEALVFLAPTLAGMLFLTLGATVGALGLSFTNFEIRWPPQFIGFQNYISFFTNKLFLKILGNTFLYAIITIVPCVIFAFLLALLVNKPARQTAFFRAVYFWPVVGSMTAIALVWKFLLNGQFGFINYLLSTIGIKGPQWFGSPKWALAGIAIIFVWKNVGYYMTLVLGGLQNISRDLIEAAIIDGAGPLRRTLFIIIPMISPVLFFVMIMASVASFQVFDSILVVNPNGGPANALMTLSFFVYQNAFTFMRMGFASAAAIVLAVIVFIVTLIQFILQDKWVFYN
jgi:multiple sugar transport system permease protein